jgi:hypothetical protein
VAQRRSNPRLAKIHRSYTVEEAARLLGVYRGTVRQWIKRGLPICDEKRPVLILGSDLREFLTTKRIRNKRPCKPGEVYCVGCRMPRRPALGVADYEPLTATSGNLVGLCPECEGVMYRRVSAAKLAEVGGDLEIRSTEGREHIVKSPIPSVNGDFEPGA